MQDNRPSNAIKSLSGPVAIFGVMFALGLLPVAFNLSVDPYQVFFERDRATVINDLAEKSHYPLWKLAKYKRGTHDTIILGDSRARALKDKYWHEGGLTTALNMAYGGGTIPEIISTFRLIKNDRNLRRLVIGIQLRSFDEGHKGGMNRVPEAIRLISNPVRYLKNWHVAKTSLKVFKAENPGVEKSLVRLADHFSMEARAGNLGNPGKTSLKKLLEPKVCFGCELPKGLASVPYLQRKGFLGGYHGLFFNGFWSDTWSKTLPGFYQADLAALVAGTPVILPAKFARQVKKNGTADWRGFELSKKYMAYIEEISIWAKSNKVELIFVIPPTIREMQKTIFDHGLGKQNHQFRLWLSDLGKVLDLDFPNSLTASTQYFSDAYHFNAKVARAIVGEILTQFSDIPRPKKRKFEFSLSCPRSKNVFERNAFFENTVLLEGNNCRIWSSENDK